MQCSANTQTTQKQGSAHKIMCILHTRMYFVLICLEICEDEVSPQKFAALWSHTHHQWQSGIATKLQHCKETHVYMFFAQTFFFLPPRQTETVGKDILGLS